MGCISFTMHYRANFLLYTILSVLLAIPCLADPPSNCTDACRPNMPYVDSDCIPIGMQALGTAIVLGLAFKLFRAHDGENEWDTIGIGYKLSGGMAVVLGKELWDQINKCIVTTIIVNTWDRCRTCQTKCGSCSN